MRTLKFIINGQIIEKDPSCDFSGLVAGTENYLQAEFAFSDEWDGRKKAATFWKLGREYPVPLYGDGRIVCKIPKEALTSRSFDVSVTGMHGNEFIPTNTVNVEQYINRRSM